MENNEKVIEKLFARLEELIRQQRVFQNDIEEVQRELIKLRGSQIPAPAPDSTQVRREHPPVTRSVTSETLTAPSPHAGSSPRVVETKNALEEFIGTNLLNKIGIAVLVLGIGFGTKYSIDHGLINPLTRIILGYFSGLILFAIALRLRTSHTAFSAVLLSGSMTVLYFITFAAHSFYDLIPQAPAFVLMVLFTCFTVFAAMRYNMEVIAVIALVGAYAVPVLLSDGSGRVVVLFSYITVINGGILFLAFRRYWKILFYVAFILTWLTFASWYAFSFKPDDHATVSLIFSTTFFATFYVTFLAYKLIRREALARWDVVAMLVNSFLYFAYGYLTIDSLPGGERFLGLFTVWTALIHFVACLIIYRSHQRSTDIFYFVAGMVLVFVTIAVPVQLEGNWVTLVWAMEAALLFWIGRAKAFPTYEKLSYPLMILALLSLFHDWSKEYQAFYYYAYGFEKPFTIFLNVNFLTSMLVGVAFLGMVLINQKFASREGMPSNVAVIEVLRLGLPLVAGFIFYVGFYKEIEAFWNNAYGSSRVPITGDEGVEYDQYDTSMLQMKTVWLAIYSGLFGSAMSLLYFKVRTKFAAASALLFNSVVLFAFLVFGLVALSSLRVSYLEQDLALYYDRPVTHVLIRYLALSTMIALLWFNHRIMRDRHVAHQLRIAGTLYLHLVVLALMSSELLHLLDMARVENSLKLSLSILWGAYALFLIVLGLSRDIRHIRLGAIILFAVTLLKLFAYDMEDMSTILKTIVMIILGALLLIASFLYNKYKRSAGNEIP